LPAIKTYQNKSFCLITLGCPKNQVDSEVLAGQLTAHGMHAVDEAEQADVILINTCGFIEDAKQESIDTILEAIAVKAHHHQELYVWGCLAQRYRGEIEKELPEVDGYFGIEPFESMGRHFLGSAYRISPDVHARRVLTTPPHTAYLKIADGCDHGCTFCAIPQFKGAFRSRPQNSLIREAEALAAGGVRELILIAQDTTRYGTDLNEKASLATLLRQLANIKGLEWLRVMYTHPNHVDTALIDVMAGEEKVCKYLDMPLQHIADPVLKAMGRGGSRASIEKLIDRLRNRIPGLVLRTAFIVGFPVESGADFKELLTFVRNTKFDRMGAFIYSREEGTAAYPLGDPIERNVTETRYALLMEAQQEISEMLNQKLEGKVIPVMIDEYDRDQKLFAGRTQGDCLEIDQAVWVEGMAEPGRIVPVLIRDSEPYDLFGSVVTSS